MKTDDRVVRALGKLGDRAGNLLAGDFSMRMFLRGEWVDRPQRIEIRSPFSGDVIDSVPSATLEDVDSALSAAVEGAETMRAMSGYDRFRILRKAADLLAARAEDFARTISLEEGKTLTESRGEVNRSVQTLELSGEEAKRLSGEVIPLDGAAGAGNRLGFTLRVPCGVVAAIAPFNFPLNLVCHKVGPALAAGNSLVLKPASATPLSALNLVELLLEAGLPPLAIQCLTGPGGPLGDALCQDKRVRKITFTGSREIGERIIKHAGVKKVTLELGSNCPVVVLPDADLEQTVKAVVSGGYGNAGQTCISAQRIIALAPVYGDFLDALKPAVAAIKTGDPLAEGVQMGPLVAKKEAERVSNWIDEAVSAGAKVVVGGERDGGFYQPTVLADAPLTSKVWRDELFGPAVAVVRATSVEEAIRLASDTEYGLGAAIYTQNIHSAMKFVRDVPSGNIHVNGGPSWRVDLMPYGGLKDSGLGKEGPKYAVEAMTELKMVVIHE